jgi:hypothetical protein
LGRRLIASWPTVLALVFEQRTGGERKSHVQLEDDVPETGVHSPFSYGGIASIKHSIALIQRHSTIAVLSAA